MEFKLLTFDCMCFQLTVSSTRKPPIPSGQILATWSKVDVSHEQIVGMSDTEFVNSRTTGEVRSEDLLVLQDLRNYTAIKAYDLDLRPQCLETARSRLIESYMLCP